MSLHSVFTRSPLEAQDNLDKAQANLGGVKDQQNALGAIQVDFEEFKPNINDICLKLVIFANIFHFVSTFLKNFFFSLY